jgi:hypothetical protein
LSVGQVQPRRILPGNGGLNFSPVGNIRVIAGIFDGAARHPIRPNLTPGEGKGHPFFGREINGYFGH